MLQMAAKPIVQLMLQARGVKLTGKPQQGSALHTSRGRCSREQLLVPDCLHLRYQAKAAWFW